MSAYYSHLLLLRFNIFSSTTVEQLFNDNAVLYLPDLFFGNVYFIGLEWFDVSEYSSIKFRCVLMIFNKCTCSCHVMSVCL